MIAVFVLVILLIGTNATNERYRGQNNNFGNNNNNNNFNDVNNNNNNNNNNNFGNPDNINQNSNNFNQFNNGQNQNNFNNDNQNNFNNDNQNNYYCSEDLMCTDEYNNPIKHVMCDNRLRFGPNCHTPNHIQITDELKKLFLEGHNGKRSLIAQNLINTQVFNYQAAKMETLVWDDELEMLSLAHALQCKTERDLCIRTKRYKNPGQNNIVIPIDETMKTVEFAIQEALTIWFDENKDVTDFQWMQSYGRSNAPTSKFSHFAQMIHDDLPAIGCSIVRDEGAYHITCNYATSNENGQSVFAGGPEGTNCEGRLNPNPNYKGLCDENEYKLNHINEVRPVLIWLLNKKRVDSPNNEFGNNGGYHDAGVINKGFNMISILLLQIVIAQIFFF